MATRPVFVPDKRPENTRLFREHEVDFQWIPGREPGQIKGNIARLHAAAAHRKLTSLLDVSQGSDHPLGASVCPGNLAVEDDRSYLVPLAAAYHGSQIFSGGGPFVDLYRRNEKEISVDPRLTDSGKLLGFRFMGLEWGLKSGTMFYDWLVVQAIGRYQKLRTEIRRFDGFTEIGCATDSKTVCHGRSCALYVALAEKGLLDRVVADQNLFIETLLLDPFYQAIGKAG